MFGTSTHTRTVREPTSTTIWSPAQIVAVGVGIAAIVFGAFAIAKTGFDFDHPKSPHESFQGFHHTPLLALSEIVMGAVLVLAGLRPIAGRALMTLVGAVSLGFGVIIVLDVWPHTLHDWFGVHDRNGWLFIAAGAVVLGATVFLPVVASRRTARTVATTSDDT